MKEFADIKLFDMRNPNIELNSSVYDLAYMLDNVPIFEHDEEDVYNKKRKEPIGFVKCTTYINEYEIFGCVMVCDDSIDGLSFKNYSVKLDPVFIDGLKITTLATVIDVLEISYEVQRGDD